MSAELFITALEKELGKSSIFSDPAECWAYSYDNSRKQSLPIAVMFPTTHEQISIAIRLCNKFKIPLIARGRGTGTPGGSVPQQGGLVVSMEKMARILQLDYANRVMQVEPGVINQAVQQAAAAEGFFWPPDPTSMAYCTVGGNLAYNSAGPRAIKYGTPRENTLGIKAITGAGQTIHTGVYTTKGVVGYDLTRLLIGSEGTLAVFTEAYLKLTPLPETQRTILALYSDMHTAARAVADIMAQPSTPSMLEFMDPQSVEMIRPYAKVDLPKQTCAALIIQIDGPASAIVELQQNIVKAATNSGLTHIMPATDVTEEKVIWDMRKALSPALRQIAPKKINEDVVVPVSNIPNLIAGLNQLAEEYRITIINFGHAGNGNIHVNLLIDPEDTKQLLHAQECLKQLFTLVLSLKGTLSGEHGIGLEKRDFIPMEIDPNTLQLMQSIKQQFDPNHILNPDKIFPTN